MGRWAAVAKAAVRLLPRAEKRGYRDLVVQGILSAAEVAQDTARLTAAQETAAGLWARAFAAARVTPDPLAATLTPVVLASVGRRLCLAGEAAYVLDVRGASILAREAASWKVSGPTAPWTYELDVPAPDGAMTIKRPGAAVLHFRYAPDAGSPWHGRPPSALAADTAKLLARLEARLAEEASARVGYVLPVPAMVGAADTSLATLRTDLRALAGGLALVETTSSGWGDGRSAAPQQDWQARRFGPTPPPQLEQLRSAAERSILLACGVPPALAAGGAAAREAWRQFLHATVQPVARIVEAEASEKLEAPVRLSFEALMASDIAGRARAYASLVGAGMPHARAGEVCGF